VPAKVLIRQINHVITWDGTKTTEGKTQKIEEKTADRFLFF